jgi:hypothetical protein
MLCRKKLWRLKCYDTFSYSVKIKDSYKLMVPGHLMKYAISGLVKGMYPDQK